RPRPNRPGCAPPPPPRCVPPRTPRRWPPRRRPCPRPAPRPSAPSAAMPTACSPCGRPRTCCPMPPRCAARTAPSRSATATPTARSSRPRPGWRWPVNKTLLACALAAATFASGAASAATIIPVNMNAPGIGLNDPTPATPVGGNPGTTVGEQRRIAYQFAADLWGAVLESDAVIRVQAQFTALNCSASSAVLGSAGTRQVFANFANAPLAETWYGGALANAIAGSDLAPAEDEITSNFNSNLGQPNCLAGSFWYYGLDGNTPAGQVNFLDVGMHEIGHGLNFQGFYTLNTGAPFSGRPDVYSSFVYDNNTDKTWVEMTNAEHMAATTGGGLAWTGDHVLDQVPLVLSPMVELTAGGTVSGTFQYGTAQFGAAATPENFSGELVLVNDGSANPTF